MAIAAPITTIDARGDRAAGWLARYYAARAAFSVVWVALAFTVGRTAPGAGLALLVAYPLWDCLANAADAARSGGLRANPTQALNAAVSAVVTLAVAVAAGRGLPGAIGVIGVWAGLAGLLQLATGLRRRRRAHAQWPQMLSGAQSCLAAVHFVMVAAHPAARVDVSAVAPYAAFGAFYFAISAGVLLARRQG